MSKFLLIIIIAFNLYAFSSINGEAKNELVRVSMEIPVKLVQVVQSVDQSVRNWQAQNTVQAQSK